jgi:hypothetical protein
MIILKSKNLKIKIMGDFRIVIDAVGGHGQDRDKKDGEVVDFSNGGNDRTPESVAQRLVNAMQANGVQITSAKVIHWPADNYPEQREAGKEIVDCLLTGVRKGSF